MAPHVFCFVETCVFPVEKKMSATEMAGKEKNLNRDGVTSFYGVGVLWDADPKKVR
jgi:hypothetical protein